MTGTILTRTNLASTAFTDGSGVHIRVYYQDGEGNIRETYYDRPTGWGLRDHDAKGPGGTLNTGIGALCWDEGKQMRMYYFDKSHHLVERCYEGHGIDWVEGHLVKCKFPGAPTSSVASTYSNGSIQVFYQGVDGYIWKAINNRPSSWTTHKLPVKISFGATISACLVSPPHGKTATHVFSTDFDNQLIDIRLDDDNPDPCVRTITSAGSNRFIGGGIASTPVCHGHKIVVLSVLADNNIMLSTCENNIWSSSVITTIDTTITNSAMSCYLRPDGRINSYFQPSGQHVSELTSDDNGQNFQPNCKDIPVRR